MRAKDVQVPPSGSHQGWQIRTSQRAAIDTPSISRARCRDDEDNDDGGDDDINEPIYEQDELMGSELGDATQGIQT